MPATAMRVPAKGCGCLLGDDCGCDEWVPGGGPDDSGVPELMMGSAMCSGWSK